MAAASALIDVLLGLDEAAEGIATARDLANRSPDTTEAQLMLAAAYARTGDSGSAIAQYKLISRGDNFAPEALYRIATAQSQLDAHEDASAVLYNARRQATSERAYQLTAIDVALRLGNTESAVNDATLLAKNNPNHAPSIILLGRAQQASGEYRSVVQTYTKAQALDPDNSRICLQRYRVLRADGRQSEAFKLLVSWMEFIQTISSLALPCPAS